MGNYGTVRPADVGIDDIEIFYHYTPNRGELGDTELKKLNTSEVLIKIDNPNKSINNPNLELFGGLYTLKLPVSEFGVRGIYTIYIKPIEIRTRIVDVGVLSALPDVKGIVLDLGEIPDEFLNKFENDGLIGYRIEYLSADYTNDSKINNLFRLITSNNRAEPVNQNLTNTNQKAIRYRFNDNSSLMFCTLTPSTNSVVKPNVTPFIGQPNQEIIITNTYFNPIMLEIEMVEHDIETLAYAMFGNQSKSIEDGIYTIYNFTNNIYKQYNLYEIKDQFSGKPMFEVRSQRNNIDFSKNFNQINNLS